MFAARDERLDRLVAVKVVPAPGPVPERAQREALAAARLDHPGIVAVFDAGEENGERYLVSELVRGRTLAALERDGALSDRDVLRVGLALADALEHAHDRGVIHRDVKPQNVIVPAEPARTRPSCSTSASPTWPATSRSRAPATWSARSPTWRPSRPQASGSTSAPTCTRSALVLYEALAGTNPVRGAQPGRDRAPRRHARCRRCAASAATCPPSCASRSTGRSAPNPDERGTLDDLADALAAALPERRRPGGTRPGTRSTRRRIRGSGGWARGSPPAAGGGWR